MNTVRKSVIWLTLALTVGATPLVASVGLRGGVLVPQGAFKDLAKSGGSVEVVATLQALPVSVITVAVAINTTSFGKKELSYSSGKQESKMGFTGGGFGVRVEPPSLIIRPFAEIMGRIASIEQDYTKTAGADVEIISKTRVGYQINGGLKWAFLPTTSIEVGAGYTVFPNVKLKNRQVETKTAVKTWGVFVGLRFNLGF
jgi:hypothetical protein